MRLTGTHGRVITVSVGVILSVLALLCPLRAQDPQILGFSPSGDIAWTNPMHGVYNALYFTWDLTDQWFPVWVNRQATSDVDAGGTHLSSVSGMTEVAETITAGQFDSTHAFYRIAASAMPIALSNVLITNYVAFLNSSTAIVTDITLDICWGHVSVSNLAPGAMSKTTSLAAPFQWAWDCRFTDALVFDDDTCIRFKGSYTQNGQLKNVVFPFHFFSHPGYSLIVRLDDGAYTVTYNELQEEGAKARQGLQAIAAAIEQLKRDTGRWPNGAPVGNPGPNEMWNLGSSNAGLLAATSMYVGWNGPYLSHIDSDPWEQPYFFDPDYFTNGPGGGTCIAVGSFGPNRIGPNLYDSDDIIQVLQ